MNNLRHFMSQSTNRNKATNFISIIRMFVEPSKRSLETIYFYRFGFEMFCIAFGRSQTVAKMYPREPLFKQPIWKEGVVLEALQYIQCDNDAVVKEINVRDLILGPSCPILMEIRMNRCFQILFSNEEVERLNSERLEKYPHFSRVAISVNSISSV